MNPGTRRRAAVLLALAPTVVLLVLAPAAPARASTGGSTATVALRLERDGSLSVTERLEVPAGATLDRTVPLRTAAVDDRVRVLDVRDVDTEGPVSATVVDDELRVRAGPGSSTVRYVVDGTVAAAGGGQELTWQVAGSGSGVDRVQAAVEVPAAPLSVSCRAGAPGTGGACSAASSGAESGGTTSVTQAPLGTGDRLEVQVVLPAGTVTPSARYAETFTLGRAFRVSAASVTGLLAAVVLLGAGALALTRLRGRDERAAARPATVLPLLSTDGRTRFASPDGVLPGEVGTLVDERVDPVDVTATVLDLAVRGYLRVRLVGDGPVPAWALDAAAAPDDALRSYERSVLAAVVGRTAGQLGGDAAGALDRARDELYAEVVAQGWFHRRPDRERGRWSALGLGLVVAGVASTVALAATTTLALVGIGVVAGGIAVLAAARTAPARTARGAALVSALGGLRRFLDDADLGDIAPEHREEVLARCLPYAVVLDRLERWTTTSAAVDDAADGAPGWSWLEAGTTDPARLAALTRGLCAQLDADVTRVGRLRLLR